MGENLETGGFGAAQNNLCAFHREGRQDGKSFLVTHINLKSMYVFQFRVYGVCTASPEKGSTLNSLRRRSTFLKMSLAILTTCLQ
jgi:hypothetical protein